VEATHAPGINFLRAQGGESAMVEKLIARIINADPKRVYALIGLMVIAAGLITGIWLVWPAVQLFISTLLPFIVGGIGAYIFDPILTFIQRKLGISRFVGVLLLYTVIATVIGAFIAHVLPILVLQIGKAYHDIYDFVSSRLAQSPEIMAARDSLLTVLRESGITFEALASKAADSPNLKAAAQAAMETGSKILAFIVGGVFGIVGKTFSLFTFVVFAVLVNAYMLFEFSKLRHVGEVIIPLAWQPKAFAVLEKVDFALGGFIRGILITACIVGFMTFAGMYLIGLREYALLFGILGGVGNLVPYLGPVMGGGPAVLYILFSSGYESWEDRGVAILAVLVLMAVIQMIEGFVLQPKIVGQSAQLHPLAVLFALAFGASFGLFGMIIAVPAACVVRVLVKEFYWDERQEAWHQRTGLKNLGDWKQPKAKS
jgi:predicted PurR-regulated permease PerM